MGKLTKAVRAAEVKRIKSIKLQCHVDLKRRTHLKTILVEFNCDDNNDDNDNNDDMLQNPVKVLSALGIHQVAQEMNDIIPGIWDEPNRIDIQFSDALEDHATPDCNIEDYWA
jgi:hypothetical protein